MLFSTSIPDKLQEYPSVSAFMNVLDALQDFKTEIIAKSFRVDNSAVLMDKKWLLKKLGEFGITDMPLDYPIQIMQQYLLNVDTVCRTRGSKIGIELYCSLLSLGEVTIDDSEFYAESELIFLDSKSQGYITDSNNAKELYICDDNEMINPKSYLGITIKSKYFNEEYSEESDLIKSYIESTIGDWIAFSPNRELKFVYNQNADFYFHPLLNKFFV